jgi:hypothetical protein
MQCAVLCIDVSVSLCLKDTPEGCRKNPSFTEIFYRYFEGCQWDDRAHRYIFSFEPLEFFESVWVRRHTCKGTFLVNIPERDAFVAFVHKLKDAFFEAYQEDLAEIVIHVEGDVEMMNSSYRELQTA